MGDKKKREIPSAESLMAQSDALFAAFNKEDDLPCVLLSTSYLDACLESLLHKFFIESSVADVILDPQSGFLGSFSARAKVAYCLGLITKEMYTNLDVIGQIRNRFAHKFLELTFDDPNAAALTEQLIRAKFGGGKRVDAEGNVTEMTERPQMLNTPKMRLIEVAAFIGAQLPFIATNLNKCSTPERRQAEEKKRGGGTSQ